MKKTSCGIFFNWMPKLISPATGETLSITELVAFCLAFNRWINGIGIYITSNDIPFFSSPLAYRNAMRRLITKGFIVGSMDKPSFTPMISSNYNPSDVDKGLTFFYNKDDGNCGFKCLLRAVVGSKEKGMSTEEVMEMLNISDVTALKYLKSTNGIYRKEEYNANGGKKFIWKVSSVFFNKPVNRPSYILFYYSWIGRFSSPDELLGACYAYTINNTSYTYMEDELRNILDDPNSNMNKDFNESDLGEPSGRCIKIPIHTRFKGIELLIMTLVSEFKLRGHTAVWSLEAFNKYFAIPLDKAAQACRKLLLNHYLSRPSSKDKELWREYISNKSSLKNAVTVKKEYNILLNQ